MTKMFKSDTTIQVNSNFHTIAGKSVVDRADARYREYRKKWEDWPVHFSHGDFPLHLDIEPTNTCNLRCPFCATTYNKYKQGFMKETTWKKILDECGKNNLYSLKFTYRGEPLLHPDLSKMVRYAKDVGVMDVYFNTNAVKLGEPVIRELIDAGLDRISISFEGNSKEVYEKYRVGASFDHVVKNIELLRDIKKELGAEKPLVRIQTVLVPELQGHEQEYATFWKSRSDEVAYLDMKDEMENPDHRGIIDYWACPQLFQRMTITWEGTILPCVHDIYEWMSLGKIETTTIKEAWNSAAEQNYRERHKAGKAHEIPACDRCPLRENEIDKIHGGK
ncbi:MAG: radical SAM/SPASM domain-containing protein [Methanoregula sp.]